jgi:hypothetical protein
MLFVTLDRMMSMVHNTYAPTVLRLLANWDETNADPETNTIDRYLQTKPQLRVVTTIPFLVEHHEELYSSLWGFQNAQYNDLIANAEVELNAKVAAFEGRAATAAVAVPGPHQPGAAVTAATATGVGFVADVVE